MIERILASLIIAGCLIGCETVSPDGTVSRWDADATAKGITTALDTWQRIDQQSRVIGYDAAGRPIYAR